MNEGLTLRRAEVLHQEVLSLQHIPGPHLGNTSNWTGCAIPGESRHSFWKPEQILNQDTRALQESVSPGGWVTAHQLATEYDSLGPNAFIWPSFLLLLRIPYVSALKLTPIQHSSTYSGTLHIMLLLLWDLGGLSFIPLASSLLFAQPTSPCFDLECDT